MAITFGISFTTPFAVGWSYFPRHHGKVSGVMCAGFGLASTGLIMM